MEMQLYIPFVWLVIFMGMIKVNKAIGTKLVLYSIVGSLPLSFGYIVEHVLKVDWTFAETLLGLVILDLAVSSIFHVKAGTFEGKKFMKGFVKFFAYWILLRATYLVSHYQVEGAGDSNPFSKWPYYIYALVAGRELYSIFKHMRNLGFNVVPKPIWDGLARFLKTGNPKDIFINNTPKTPDENGTTTENNSGNAGI